MTADVDILTTYVPNAIVVPNDAIVKSAGKSYVFVVQNGVARKQLVRVGKVADTQTWVTSGLTAGATIVAARLIPKTAIIEALPMIIPSIVNADRTRLRQSAATDSSRYERR